MQHTGNTHPLRYTRDDVIMLLGLRPGVDLHRAIRSRPGFPEKLPGTVPPLWSRKAVDDWFNSDAGRRQLAEPQDDGRISLQSADQLDIERDFLNSRYGGRS
jgi:hypothetical protein